MNTHIALFRGINVGGHNLLPMKTLVAMLERLGATNVRTYIQSGNAVFQTAEKNPSRLARNLAAEIKRQQGFAPQILLLDLDAMNSAVANNPFPEAEADPGSLHLGFLASVPKSPGLEKLAGLKRISERFLLRGKVFYLHAPEGVGNSRMAANTEKLLGVPLTDRNWRTVCRIRDLAKTLNDGA